MARLSRRQMARATERASRDAEPLSRRDGSYYASDRAVFRAPLEKINGDGTRSFDLGFRVCLVSDYCDDDAPDEIARCLNAHDALLDGLRLAAVRLGILAARMRACHSETGRHELLHEADDFEAEARELIAEVEAGAVRPKPPAAPASATANEGSPS